MNHFHYRYTVVFRVVTGGQPEPDEVSWVLGGTSEAAVRAVVDRMLAVGGVEGLLMDLASPVRVLRIDVERAV